MRNAISDSGFGNQEAKYSLKMTDGLTKTFVSIIDGKDLGKSLLMSKNKLDKLIPCDSLLGNEEPKVTLYNNSKDGEQVNFYEIVSPGAELLKTEKFKTFLEHISEYHNEYKTNKLSKFGELKMTFLKDYSGIQKNDERIIEVQNSVFMEDMKVKNSKELLQSRHGRDLQVYRSDIELAHKSKKKKPRHIALGIILNKQNDKVLMIERSKKNGLIFPKGGCDRDEWPLAGISALRETWEEAGAICKIEKQLFNKIDVDPLSSTSSGKNHSFSVFEMSIVELKENWPECEKRENGRFWLTYSEAEKMFTQKNVFDDALKALYVVILQQSGLIKRGSCD